MLYIPGYEAENILFKLVRVRWGVAYLSNTTTNTNKPARNAVEYEWARFLL
jgi:hypothetical protein